MSRTFITTAIPYVNSKPHLGFAMELVQADVIARHRGHQARFCSSTDDNSLKNAMAAEVEGIPREVPRTGDTDFAAREATKQLGDGEDHIGDPTPLFPHVEVPSDA